MGAESIFYYPLELVKGAGSGSVDAPFVSTLDHNKDEVVILSESIGHFGQGLYAFDGVNWRFLAPMPIVSKSIINAYTIAVYVNPDLDVTLPDTSVVYKNGVLTTSHFIPHGVSVWASFTPYIPVPVPPGPDVISYTALTDVGSHRVMRISIGGVTYAFSNDIEQANLVLGITQTSGTAGAKVNVQTSGELTEPGWNWIPGLPVFCGLNGLITQDVPSIGFALIVGQVSTPQTIIVTIKQPIIVGV